MMIYAISKRDHHCARKTPTKASCNHRIKSTNVKFSKRIKFVWIADSWQYMIVMVSPEYFIDDLPFIIKFFSVLFDLPYKNDVLKFLKFAIFPHHWQVWPWYDFKIWMPKWLLTQRHLMHHVNYHSIVFCISMCFEEFRVFIKYQRNIFVSFSKIINTDNEVCRDVKKSGHWWNIFFCSHTNELAFRSKRNRVIYAWCHYSIFITPLFKVYVSYLRLNLLCLLLIY